MVTRIEVLTAYELILQRPPESEEAISYHETYPDLLSLGRHMTGSEEFRKLHPQSGVPEHHIYSGYAPSEVAVFRQFPAYSGQGTKNFVTNFLGVKTRCAFQAPLIPFDGLVEGFPEPVGSTQGETAEWIGTLRAVLEAKSSFRMLELGAGYGPWMAITYAASVQRGIADIKVYGVEGDANHVTFMRANMVDNRIDDDHFVVFHAAVGATDGSTYWAVETDSSEVYGARPIAESGDDYLGNKGREVLSIKLIGINVLLENEQYWDLVHIDIQGHEIEVCRAGIAQMCRRVRRVVVGTHSRAIDGAIFDLFYSNGWILENEKPTIYKWNEAFPTLEAMTTVDGVQVWRNPNL